MSPDGSVHINQVWKRFRADRNRQLLRDEVSRFGQRLRGAEPERWRWALRDVSFDIEPGDSLALIGSNGSGKSTMLKLLAGIMFPTYGTVEARGRIGALIEVRAGIHPDLTGRENVYVYGSLLGLKRADVKRRFDAIVEFAELQDAIDRQVKFYSSGMGMRLGFAVAAFLEPDIMVVDEVLAVGDASFQQRCLDRMREVMLQGTTLLYVSHDLATVEAMCRQAMWIDKGVAVARGPTDDVIAGYRRAVGNRAIVEDLDGADLQIRLTRAAGPGATAARSHENIVLDLEIVAREERESRLVIGISEGSPVPAFIVQSDVPLQAGINRITCEISSVPLAGGCYTLYAAAIDDSGRTTRSWSPIGNVELEGVRLGPPPTGVVRQSPIAVESVWCRDT